MNATWRKKRRETWKIKPRDSCFSKVPKLYRCISGVITSTLSSVLFVVQINEFLIYCAKSFHYLTKTLGPTFMTSRRPCCSNQFYAILLRFISLFAIGHLWITLGLFFKASPAAHLFIWKLVFICMRIKTNFRMKGWAPGLAFKKRQKVIRKWPIYICNRVKETFHTWTASLMANLLTEVILTLSSFCGTQPTTSPNDKEPYLQKTGIGVWNKRKAHKYVNKGGVRLSSKFFQEILQKVQSVAG